MIKRLFVVTNPTQYLNAVEYVYQQGNEDDHMVIITPFSNGIEELNKIGANSFWKSVHFLDTQPYRNTNDRKFWKVRSDFLYSACREVQPSELVVGNLIDSIIYPFVLRKAKKIKSITVLDDGTPTLGVASKRKKRNFYSTYHFLSWTLLIKTLFYLKTFPPLHFPPKVLTFFTLFNISIRDGDKIITNDFKWLKTKVKNRQVKDEALFIGANLVDKGLVSECVYLRSLQIIKQEIEFEGMKFAYCHHRGESARMRSAVKKICKTVDFHMPLELALLDCSKPVLVAGHFTSALFTLSRIYPTLPCRAYLFSEKQLQGSKYEPHDYLLMVQQTLEDDARIEARKLLIAK